MNLQLMVRKLSQRRRISAPSEEIGLGPHRCTVYAREILYPIP